MWFTAARAYCLKQLGEDALQRVVVATPAEFRHALTEPRAAAWYPEEAMQAAIAAVSHGVAADDPGHFMKLMEGCTEEGVHAAFRVFLRTTTPAFLVRQVPTMWNQIRRGTGRVRVDTGPGQARIHYTEFPYFHDPLYRLLTEASLRALLRLCTRREPGVRVVSYEADRLEVEVLYFAT